MRVIEEFKEFEPDEDILNLIGCNILKANSYKELDTYLYYTLRELYLFDVQSPICYLMGCNRQIKSISYMEMFNGVTRIEY